MRESGKGKLSAQLVHILSSPGYQSLLKLKGTLWGLVKRASLLSKGKPSLWFTQAYGLPQTSGKGTPEKTQHLLLLWRCVNPKQPQQHLHHNRPQSQHKALLRGAVVQLESPFLTPTFVSPYLGRFQ